MVGDAVLPNTERSTTVDEFTPSATLDVRITPDVLGYFTFSRGFKSGGFTQRVFPPEPEAPSFAPEFARLFEVGLKTELFDRRLRSEEHTSELQSLMRISYAVFCLKKQQYMQTI